MTEAELRALVKSIVTEVVKAHEAPAAPATAAPAPGEVAPPWSRGPRHRPLPPARSPEALSHLVTTTPARIVTGRTGTRYLTSSYLGLRADHAIALDAVESEVDEAWAAAQGWLPLRTRAKDHTEFLLHPEQGRRLDDASRAKCDRVAAQQAVTKLVMDLESNATDMLSLATQLEGKEVKVLSEAAPVGVTFLPAAIAKLRKLGAPAKDVTALDTRVKALAARYKPIR